MWCDERQKCFISNKCERIIVSCQKALILFSSNCPAKLLDRCNYGAFSSSCRILSWNEKLNLWFIHWKRRIRKYILLSKQKKNGRFSDKYTSSQLFSFSAWISIRSLSWKNSLAKDLTWVRSLWTSFWTSSSGHIAATLVSWEIVLLVKRTTPGVTPSKVAILEKSWAF